MPRVLRTSVALVLLALSLPACSSSSNAQRVDAGADTGGPTYVTACTAMAKATCAREAACSPFFIRYGFGDVTGCETAVRYRCESLGVLSGVTYAPSDVAACGTRLATMSCGTFFGGADPCVPTPGTLASGAPCYYDAQCTTGFCRASASQPCGACATPPTLGEACESTCAPGLHCARGTCVAAVAEGGACTAQGQCPLTQTCYQGKCTAGAIEGAACDANGVTAADCDFLSGLVCLGGTCAKIGLASTGAACGYSASGLTLCTGGGACAPSAASGTCQPPIALGQACGAAGGPPCVPGAICVDAVCRLPDATACR